MKRKVGVFCSAGNFNFSYLKNEGMYKVDKKGKI